MTTTQNTATHQPTDLMEFDIRCARQGIESAARSIASLSAQLATMTEQAEHPDLLAHYASVIASDAQRLLTLAQYAKGIGAAITRMKGEV